MVFALKELSRQKLRKPMWKNCDNRMNKQYMSMCPGGQRKQRPDLVWKTKEGKYYLNQICQELRSISGKYMLQVEKSELIFAKQQIAQFGSRSLWNIQGSREKNKAGNLARIRAEKGWNISLRRLYLFYNIKTENF